MNNFDAWENRLLPSLEKVISYVIDNTPFNGVFYDIGGNTGLLSQKVLEKRPDIKIVIFEPVKKYYEHIVSKFEKNNNVYCFNIALFNKKCKLEISLSNDNLGYNSLSFIEDYGEKEEISADTLSNIVKYHNIPYPDLLKIDVEESEYYVIEGCKDLFSFYKPRKLIIELGRPKIKEHRESLLNYLFSLGYKISDYTENATCDAKFELVRRSYDTNIHITQ